MTIIIDGIQADYAGSSINFIFNTPIFQDYGGEAAVDVRLPITDTNKVIFGYRHRTDVAATKRTHNVIFKLGGIEKLGQGKLNRVTSSEFEMSVGFENSDFYHLIKDKTLKDLPWGNSIVSGAEKTWNGYLKGDVSIDYEKRKTKIQTQRKEIGISGLQLEAYNLNGDGPINVPHGYKMRIVGHIDVTYASECRIILSGVKLYTSNRIGTVLLSPTDIKTSTIPSTGDIDITYSNAELCNSSGYEYRSYKLFLEADSKKVDNKQRIKVTLDSFDAYLTPSDDKKFVDPQPYPTDSYALPGFYAPNFLSNIADSNDEATRFGTWPKVNHYEPNPGADEDHYPPFSVNGETGSVRNIFCPMPYAAKIFDLIAEFAGYTITKSIFEETKELQQLVIYNNYIENHLEKNDSKELMATSLWDLSKHVSDAQISEFIGILDLFGAKLFANSKDKTISILSLKSILHGRIGFEISSPTESFELESGFDNIDFTFNCSEGLSNELCQEIDPEKGYIGDRTEIPTDITTYKSVVRRAREGEAAQYFTYVQGFDEDDEPIDGWQLTGIAQSPYGEDKEAENTYSVEPPIGPVFAAPLKLLLDNEHIYQKEADFETIPDEDVFSDKMKNEWNKFATVVEDTALIDGSYDSIGEMPTMAISFARQMSDGSTLLCHEAGIGKDGVPKDIALRWEGANGLYETFWKDVAQWLKSAKKVRIRLPYMEVLDFERLKSAIKIRVNQQNYIVDTIQAEIGDTVRNVEIDAYTC